MLISDSKYFQMSITSKLKLVLGTKLTDKCYFYNPFSFHLWMLNAVENIVQGNEICQQPYFYIIQKFHSTSQGKWCSHAWYTHVYIMASPWKKSYL